MSQQDPVTTSPQDESLKRAIRAAWAHEEASGSLRHRVQMAMTRTILEEPEIPATTRRRQFWDAWPVPVRMAVGIAALMFMAIGGAWGLMEYQDWASRPAVQAPTHLTPAATPTLYAMLVSRHDDVFAGEEADAPPADRLISVRDALATQLHHTIWIPDLVKLGWKVQALRIYPINGVSAVVVRFARGQDEISAFSMPVMGDDPCIGSMPDVDELVDSRSLSTFYSDGLLFGLVGSRGAGPYPQADLRALVNQFRADAACRSDACATTAPSPAAP